MLDYFELREIVAQGGNYLNARRYKDAVNVLSEILNYPQEYIDMEK